MVAQIAYHNHGHHNYDHHYDDHQNHDSQASRRDGSDCQGHPGDKKGQLSHSKIPSEIEKYIANILVIWLYMVTGLLGHLAIRHQEQHHGARGEKVIIGFMTL